MKLSLGQAAKMAGVAKGTISAALKDGRMSGSKNDKGQYEIDPSEVERVFPSRSATAKLNETEPPQNGLGIAEKQALEREIALLRELLERADQNLERANLNADEWRKQAQTLALTDERRRQPAGLWARLTGRAA